MSNSTKRTKQLLEELPRLRLRIQELENLKTACKKTEKTLRQSEEKFRLIFETMPDAVMLFDADSMRFLEVNKACQHLYGYTEDQFLKLTKKDITAEPERTIASINGTLNGDSNTIPVRYHRKKDGTIFPVEISTSTFETAGRRVLCAVVRDITEREKVKKALEESEEKYRKLAENSLTGIFILQDDKYVFVNNTFAQMHGYTPQELLGTEYSDLIHPDEREKIAKIISERLKGENPRQLHEIRRIKNDGRTIWCQMMLSRIEYLGKPALMGNVIDITPRKLAETEIVSLAKFPAENPNPVLRISKSGLVLYSNKAALPLLQAWQCGEHRLLSGRWYQDMLDVLNSADNAQVEVKCADRVFALTLAPVVDANYVNVYGQDITNYKIAEQALAAERNLLRTLVDNVPDSIYVKDTDGRLVFCNAELARRLGVAAPDELIGKSDFDFYPKILAQKYFADEQRIIKTGQPIISQEEFVHLRKINKKCWLLVTKVPMRDSQGRIIGIIGIGRNITDRRKTRDKLLDYQAKLKALHSQLLMTEERQRQRLAVGLHDTVGQELALAKLALQSSLDAFADTKIIAPLGKIRELIDQAIENVHSLTLELGNPVLYELGLEAAVEDYLADELREKYGINYRLTLDTGLLRLNNDVRAILFRIVRELLINIVKHAKATTVNVTIHKSRHKVKVIVEDDGVGFPASQQGSAQMQRRLKGFGLFSIREQLEYTGGSVDIKSTVGEGTRITVTMPI